MPEDDPLAAVREADRLVREATERAERMAGDLPPRGWAAPEGESRSAFGDLAALSGLIELARGSIPPELARQLADALRQLLLALRALIDFWIERLEAGEREPVQVEDIPIE